MATRGRGLEEILGDTPSGKLEQPCLDEHLCEIARHITDWPALAPLMGITAPEMEEIREKWLFSVGGQRIEFMRKWKKKHGQKGTYRRLCKAFWKAEEVTMAEKVCEILCSQENFSKRSSCVDESHDPLEPLADYLRMTYGSVTPDFIALQWPPPPTLTVFNLAMFPSQETVRRRPLDENLVRLTVTGNVDDIMKMKNFVQMEELFKCCHVSKDRRSTSFQDRIVILVEGAPGVGKSTLAWDICQKWKARETFHEDFKVIVYIQLQDLVVQSPQEIADLLPFKLHSKQTDAASLIENCCGEGVLFILDGWDEYSPGLQQGSFLEKLICHPEMLSVQKSTILITSRPIASGMVQRYATSRVEIVGFMPDDVGRYFGDVFEDVTVVQKLHEHLQERPLIKASCYLPLNAAIVAHLFMELNYTLPTTLHGLFTRLVLSCIIRHLTKESGTDPDITSLDELPPDIQETLQKVCIVAYEGVMCDKVIFTSQDLCLYGLPKDFNTLSLMHVVQSFATSKPKSYHFLHLSIQELLAARHISRLLPLKQVQIFTKLFGKPRFDAVFRFYAAFTKLRESGSFSHVLYRVPCQVKRRGRHICLTSCTAYMRLMMCLFVTLFLPSSAEH